MSDIRYFDKMRTSQVPQEPCVGCKHYLKCALDELACFAFAQYVDDKPMNKAARIPTKEIYAIVFDEDEGQTKLL